MEYESKLHPMTIHNLAVVKEQPETCPACDCRTLRRDSISEIDATCETEHVMVLFREYSWRCLDCSTQSVLWEDLADLEFQLQLEYRKSSATVKYDELLNLAKILRWVSESEFDYSQWLAMSNEGPSSEDGSPGCGTVACALGHAALHMRHLDISAYLDPDEDDAVFSAGAHEVTDPISAACWAFNLSKAQARYLFIPLSLLDDHPLGPSRKASAKDVAEHIERFCVRYAGATP